MSDEPIRISPNFKFFLTFHFSLGFSIEYSANKDKQLSKLESIADSLNDSLKDHTIFKVYTWSVRKFDEEFPLSLQAKHGYLLGKCDGPTEELQTIINNRSEEYDGVKLDFGTITEEVVYFDHGVGSINLLIKGELENLEEFKLKDLETKLSRFAGLQPKEYRDFKGIQYLAEGYDGQIALLSDARQEAWIMNLWQFITDYYTAVRDFEKYLYDWAPLPSKGSQSYDQEYINAVLESLDKIELLIDMLTHESLPYNFAGTDDEKSIYEGIYESWYMEKAVNSLHDKYKTLSERVNYLDLLLTEEAERRSTKIQRRLNYLVIGLALITLVSVSKDIYDFKSSNVDVGYVDVLFSLSYAPKLCMLGLGVLILYCIYSLLVRKK